MPNLSRLAANRVRPSTQVQYIGVLLLLLRAWLHCLALPVLKAPDWGVLLCEFLEHLFDEGHALSTANRVPCSVL